MLSAKPEPIESRFRLSYSSLLHLIERLGRERLHEAWDKSFNRFQHRARSRKAREHNDVRQRAPVDAHLALLEELGYLQEDRLTPRGRIARLLYGYELLITEMLFRGVLEPLPKAALAVVFVGLVHSERRPGGGPHVPARLFGNVRRQVDQLASRLLFEERRKGVPTPLKLPEWGLTAAVTRWVDGAELEELFEVADVTPGDLCRTFRMALQLVRQVRRTLDRRDGFGDRLDAVVEAMNRGEIDARRQLELG
jgi:superfamily II RNA helicase